MNEPCEECPWRRDVSVERSASYFERWQESCDVGFGRMFICDETRRVCVGYLLSPDSLNNRRVRIAIATHQIVAEELHSSVPLYRHYVEMAAANGVHIKLKE